MAEQHHHVLGQGFGLEVNRFQFRAPGLDLAELQDLVDHPQQRIAAAADDVYVVTLGRVQRGGPQQAGHADHAVHGRADLMAHGGQESRARRTGTLGRQSGLVQSLQGAHDGCQRQTGEQHVHQQSKRQAGQRHEAQPAQHRLQGALEDQAGHRGTRVQDIRRHREVTEDIPRALLGDHLPLGRGQPCGATGLTVGGARQHLLQQVALQRPGHGAACGHLGQGLRQQIALGCQGRAHAGRFLKPAGDGQ